MEIQDFDLTAAKIKRRFKENPNSGLKALFKELRAEARSSFFGDFAIMAEIVREADRIGKLTWKKMSNMLREGEEYQSLTRGEKASYFNSLLHTATNKLTLSHGSSNVSSKHPVRVNNVSGISPTTTLP